MPNNDNNVEKTEILYRMENITNKVLQSMLTLHKTIDACYNSVELSFVVSTEPFMNAARDFVHRNGKIRVLTEITNDNIAACKEMMKIADVRHLEGIVSTFGVSEKDYFGHVALEPSGQHSHAIYSNVRKYVESQQYLFDTLWKNAIPAKQRIREIEQGAKREVTEITRDPYEIQKTIYELIKSAKKEILLIFSTANAFHRQIKAAGALLQLLKETAASHRIKVRILVPMEQQTINEMVDQLKGHGIDVRDNKKPLQKTTTVTTTLVVDQAHSLTVELVVDTKEMSEEEAIGMATYCNSESTAMTYISVFETLWMQNEVYYRDRQQYQKAHV